MFIDFYTDFFVVQKTKWHAAYFDMCLFSVQEAPSPFYNSSHSRRFLSIFPPLICTALINIVNCFPNFIKHHIYLLAVLRLFSINWNQTVLPANEPDINE